MCISLLRVELDLIQNYFITNKYLFDLSTLDYPLLLLLLEFKVIE